MMEFVVHVARDGDRFDLSGTWTINKIITF